MSGTPSYVLRCGDAADLIRKVPANSIDALVTDPPAGISFMGKTWDDPKGYGYTDGGNRTGAPPTVNLGRNPTCQTCGGRKRAGPATRGCSCETPDFNDAALRLRDREAFIALLDPIFRECLRVMKPGAHGLVWALPRTSHWTTTALEDAGFEIRDIVMHLFGTGFPKSLNVGKAVPAFNGWGTALKPAAEHWILVRKPINGTVAANVLEHGTGALNIDASRIGFTSESDKASAFPGGKLTSHGKGALAGPGAAQTVTREEFKTERASGRFPSHLILDEEAAAALDEQSGERVSGAGAVKVKSGQDGAAYGQDQRPPGTPMISYADRGGASRFFYVAKAGRAERDAGCDDLPARSGGEATDREDGSAGLSSPRAGAGRTGGARNHHPTVKSLALMRYLCRLITPPNGLVLDPFMGSGSTGCAALAEGFRFAGIEREPDYFEIASRRISHAGKRP